MDLGFEVYGLVHIHEDNSNNIMFCSATSRSEDDKMNTDISNDSVLSDLSVGKVFTCPLGETSSTPLAD